MSLPPPLPPHRDPGDAWVEAPDGSRYWGRFGAAGLLAHDEARGVLMQHRADWSHHGGTWGIPGGARHTAEHAIAGALRESAEEAGVPAAAVLPRALHVLDRQVWTYTTVVASVHEPFDPVAGDAESLELAWIPVDRVERLPLHPGFAASWPMLRATIGVRPTIVVDAANVVGSVPDGWWKDRAGAASRLLARLAALASAGVPAAALGLPLTTWLPEIVAVTEGRARAAPDVPGVRVIRAPGEGDDAIAAEARARASRGDHVVVVTGDRGLRARVAGFADTRGANWILELLGDEPAQA
ncbi:NUDIX hydrolase [Demequina sp.]|uniref:NUDIX domain-containing protein n=1 Tax=Demequina sp. TaxID=2050685 RepID=UPI0025F10FDA|nr:NUDIX hydrolase [Demequina sp.]